MEKKSEKKEDGEKIYQVTKDLFQNMGDLLKGEMYTKFNELILLENMNKFTTSKYEEMNKGVAKQLKMFEELNRKYAAVQPVLKETENVSRVVNNLRRKVEFLDNYTKRLENALIPFLK